jgi:predicted Fe-S protein YdhL (DUF1289 family)
MNAACVAVCTVLYAVTGFGCYRRGDYPHALMWVAYSFANVGLLWYELKK